MFSFLKEKLNKIYSQVTLRLKNLFSNKNVDDHFFDELEKILLEADVGVSLTRQCIDYLKNLRLNGDLKTGEDAQKFLILKLEEILSKHIFNKTGSIFLLVGINGSGKTTFVAKLANFFKTQGKKVLIIAADTFRAAAQEQLDVFAKRIGVDIFAGKINQDPASVIFAGCEKFKNEKYDILIIDTAGRLQNKINLMREIEKINRVISKVLPEASMIKLLTIDAMLGQNSFNQAKIFNEIIKLDGVVLTKMDSTGKGGTVFAINQELQLPVAYVSFGEEIEQIKAFDPKEYLNQLFKD